MGLLVPLSKITENQYKELIDSIKAKLLNLAAKELNKSPADLVLREVMPMTDLGYTTETWDNENALTATTWTTEISHALDNDEYIAFIGVENQTDDPQVIGMKFKVGSGGATTRDIQMLESLYTEDNHKAMFKDPIIYKANEYVFIQYYAKATVAAAGEKIGLIAFIVKPYGEEISGPLPY